jgi:hypothetical protein
MRVVAAEGHGGEREERRERTVQKPEKAGFLADFGLDLLLS